MIISLDCVVEKLKDFDKVTILCHKNPDGDTIGSGHGLYYALKSMGKSVRILCSDPFPQKYNYMFDTASEDFETEHYVTVDVADRILLGKYMDYPIELSIDHHASHKEFADNTYVAATAAATAEMMYDILKAMNAHIDQKIANCLYTGLVTDTGCFRFSNTTSHTHSVGAKLLDMGAEHVKINQLMFENKSKKRVMIERDLISSMEFHDKDRISLIVITKEDIQRIEDETDTFDGISAISRQITGVEIGVTIRYQDEEVYKISLRTSENVDASKICSHFDGGGHLRAAGCTLTGDVLTVKNRILEACSQALS